jgi:Fe-Mn family superoxide dismutase
MYKLPDLPYSYNALEPYIDEETMRVHHDKHHQGYVNKLNSSLEGYEELADKPISELLANLSTLPEAVKSGVRKFGGGHFNHFLFWESMSPEGKEKPEGFLAEEIEKVFGSFEDFKMKFKETAAGVFGSGWAWLVVNSDGGLEIVKTGNQDNPISDKKVPILGVDVWEHAYYLKYKNERGSYLDAWWNVVDWEKVKERFEEAK